MTKQMFTALALIALGLIGVTLALCTAFLTEFLPPEHAAQVDQAELTRLFYIALISGIVLLCVGACKLEDAREEQAADRKLNARKEEKVA